MARRIPKEEREAIAEKCKQDLPLRVIAAEFGVSEETVSRIKRGDVKQRKSVVNEKIDYLPCADHQPLLKTVFS